ncbi:peroxisomal multifunctional enzyme type 2-like [Montipora capricornis]|uniref:peroxisomal multifunctional enzyme type 2-like n=1 Tax=Montipora capricornis TaxID=246305 RepID=UPI0035F18360
MVDKLRFDGRVVLVTGAGGGLGREYALAFASRGASVVVNDLGGDKKGGGKSSSAADKVVEEIRSRGGKAIADYNSVEDGEKVVQTALDAFDRIDVLINNAGILRDRSFGRTSDLDWDLVHRVHLRGAFNVTRAAWPHMRKQKYGKIIMTSSTSGVLGNFGQANYSAAKLGLVGLSNTLSLEGKKYNIHCNSIVPTAASRLTHGILPSDVMEALKPEYVAPYVVFLCHETCPETGGVFPIAGGWASQLRWQESAGVVLFGKGGQVPTAEMVRDNWANVTDWSGHKQPETKGALNFPELFVRLEEAKAASMLDSSAETKSVYEKVRQLKDNVSTFTYEFKDVILYALGVGVKFQEDFSHLKFVYERHDNFSVLPSYGVISAQSSVGPLVSLASEAAGIPLDFSKFLHGEQYLELYKPIPKFGTLTNTAHVIDILDKGKGALILVNVTTKDDKEEAVCFNQFSFYIGGGGGFGGKRHSDHAKSLVATPSRSPDASIQEKTSCSQALWYRLSGDYNPIHIEPEFAQMGGFSTPILHGLCSFGFAVRHVLRQYANDDVTKFKAIKTRFSKPVIPGQTIQTDMWRDRNRVFFQCKVVENGQIALSGGFVDLKDITDSKKSIPNGNALALQPMNAELKSEAFFKEIGQRVSNNPDLVKNVNGIFEWNVTKGGKPAGQWIVDLKTGSGSVMAGPCKQGKPDCTLTVEDDDLMSIAKGKANPQQLFIQGKLKVMGNIMLSMKLGQIFKERAKM